MFMYAPTLVNIHERFWNTFIHIGIDRTQDTYLSPVC